MGIVSLEITLNPYYRSLFDGSQFSVRTVTTFQSCSYIDESRSYILGSPTYQTSQKIVKCLYIDSDVPVRSMGNAYFSTRCGDSLNRQDFKCFG